MDAQSRSIGYPISGGVEIDKQDFVVCEGVQPTLHAEYQMVTMTCSARLAMADQCLRDFLLRYDRADFHLTADRNTIADPVIRAAFDDASCFLALVLETRMKLYPLLMMLGKLDDHTTGYRSYIEMLNDIRDKVKKSRKITRATRQVALDLISKIVCDYIDYESILVTPTVCTEFIKDALPAEVMLNYYVFEPKLMVKLCLFGGIDNYFQDSAKENLPGDAQQLKEALDDDYNNLLEIIHTLLKLSV